MTQTDGFIHPQFEPVKEAFSNNFDLYNEAGAACSVYYQGKCVVDIWGGLANTDTAVPWQQDTLQLVFSAAKGLTTVCILKLVEKGKLDLDKPVAEYWPEFAANGKQDITTRMVMSHRAGLAAVDGDLTLEDVYNWHPVVEAIAAQKPNWPPGTAHGYHARSFGWILGEILRRIEGVSISEFLQQEIAQPLQLDMWIGLPEEKIPLCAKVIPPQQGVQSIADMLGSTSLTAQVMNGPSDLFDYDQMWNTPELLKAIMPSSNAVTNALSLAKFYASLIGKIDGIQLLTDKTIHAACEVQSQGADNVILTESKFGTGFTLPPFLAPFCSPNSFGHAGAGGSLGFADPDAEISFGYVMNRMCFEKDGDPRSQGLLKALYSCL